VKFAWPSVPQPAVTQPSRRSAPSPESSAPSASSAFGRLAEQFDLIECRLLEGRATARHYSRYCFQIVTLASASHGRRHCATPE
jgi:hypothetical protein